MRQRCYFERNECEIRFIGEKISPLQSVMMVLTTLLLGREKAFHETAAVLVGGLRITCPPAELARYLKPSCRAVQSVSGTDVGLTYYSSHCT